ncbi:MAG: phosphate acyltransferase PlsX [Fimbriiglobus sp.]|nr:phosphate acyltransferase PlsX [Fimbriiglobus sp.]
MRIALDAMGGDHGPKPNVAGAVAALTAAPDLSVVLVGDKAPLDPILAAIPHPADRLEVFHASEVVGMNEKPVDALRKKPDNSIARCWQLLATKKVDGLVSAGNTGAVVGAGVFTRKFLKGIRKPGIATVLPTVTGGKCVILDVGANVHPKPGHLLHYGVMGAVFAKHMLGVDKPRIGLMNVGEEEGKGHDLVQTAFDLFRKSPLSDCFIGNVEGRDVHNGRVDVIVTDGFTGNVILKHAEGQFEFMVKLVGQAVIGQLQAEKELGAKLLAKLVDKFHHSSTGGAPLLGVDGCCIICHGSSDDRAIANALGAAAQEARVKLNEKIVEELAAMPAVADDE